MADSATQDTDLGLRAAPTTLARNCRIPHSGRNRAGGTKLSPRVYNSDYALPGCSAATDILGTSTLAKSTSAPKHLPGSNYFGTESFALITPSRLVRLLPGRKQHRAGAGTRSGHHR